jgi:hypothetical protein
MRGNCLPSVTEAPLSDGKSRSDSSKGSGSKRKLSARAETGDAQRANRCERRGVEVVAQGCLATTPDLHCGIGALRVIGSGSKQRTQNGARICFQLRER